MKKTAAALVLGCALLAAAVAGATTGRTGSGGKLGAVPPIAYGVADDMSKYADDGGSWFYGQLGGANLTENRWTLAWNPSSPTTIAELPFLQRAAQKAQAAGIHVVLALYSTQASQHDPNAFCAWAATVADTVKGWGIHDFIVWNEPNTRLYWTPQKDASGADVAAPAYEQLLATCYDALHGADSSARVIGMGLSPRASTSDSTEPLVFLRDVGAAYRASGRTAPIMDQLSIHPYPNPNSPTDSPDVGYQVTDRYGIPNLDRVKKAVYDAFNGTGQPTTVNGLTFRIDEIGWQTDTSGLPQYVNQENVAVVSEATQTQYLKTMVEKYFACDPTVTDVELFLLVDEKYRNGKDENGKVVGGGWQSGLLTAGGQGVSQPKQAYSALKSDFGAGRSACTGSQVTWSPTGGSSSGDSSGTLSATQGDPDGVVDPATQAALETALANAAQQQASLPALSRETAVALSSYYQGVLAKLLFAAGAAPGPVVVSGFLFVCTSTSCTAAGAVTGAFAALGVERLPAAARPPGFTAVARGVATTALGKKTALKLKSALRKGAKAPVGKYFLVVTMTSKADPTKKYAFGIQVRSIVTKAKPVKKKHRKH